MPYKSFTLDSQHSKVYGRYIEPSPIKGVVVLVHGFGEHSGRYVENVVPTLIKTGLAVVLYDNFGHGKTEGKRGHCPSYDALLTLLDATIKKARALFPEKPLFLYGHSMGGNLALNYAMRNPTDLQGMVVTSPYLRLAFEPPKWKLVLGKLMLRVWPSLTLPSGLDPKGISQIPEAVEKYTNDPLVHDKVSPMYSFPIMDAGAWAITHASKLETPTILLHGTDDPIIDCKGTEEFHQNSNVTQLALIKGGFHELHHDMEKERVLQLIENWLRQQL